MVKRRIIFLLFLVLLFFSCKKDPPIISDIDPPNYSEIPTILLENYVNRIYIDHLGREPFDLEMENDVQYLRDNNVAMEYRDSLLIKLQTDTLFIEGNTSYKHAYYHWLYETIKIRLLAENPDGISDNYIQSEAGITYAAYVNDSTNGRWIV